MIIRASLNCCFGPPPRRASRFRPRARPRPGFDAPTRSDSGWRAVGDACVPRLRRVAPAQPQPLECFHSATCPQPTPGESAQRLGTPVAHSAASTAIKLCLCVIRRVTAPQCAQRCCRCVLVRLQTLAATFLRLLRRKRAPTARFHDRQQAPCSLRPAVLRWQALRTRCLYYLTDQASSGSAHARRGDT